MFGLKVSTSLPLLVLLLVVAIVEDDVGSALRTVLQTRTTASAYRDEALSSTIGYDGSLERSVRLGHKRRSLGVCFKGPLAGAV